MKRIKKIIVENVDHLTIAFVIVGLISTIYIIGFRLTDEEKTTINVISILGSIASFFGLAIAFIQIMALKEITEVTRNTIDETKSRLLLGISISEVTESIKLTQEIDNYIGTEKYEIARVRIIDLRDKLLQFKTSNELHKIVKVEELNEIVSVLNIHLSNLHEIVYSENDLKYEGKDLSNLLQKIATYLTDFKNNIKFQTV